MTTKVASATGSHAPLLAPACQRSDAPSSSSGMTVLIESLSPARGDALDVAPWLTVAELKQRYLALQRESALESGGLTCFCPLTTSLRLIIDGVELEDEQTLESCGVPPGARLCVVSLRSRRGCYRAAAFVGHWWPLGLVLLLWGALYAEASIAPIASGPAARCSFRLRLLLFSGAPLLLPFGLVVSGRFQEQRGRRLLWFLRHSPGVSKLVLASGFLSLAWLTLGGCWLFGSTCADVRQRADADADAGSSGFALYDTTLGAWALLLLLNTPWCAALARPRTPSPAFGATSARATRTLRRRALQAPDPVHALPAPVPLSARLCDDSMPVGSSGWDDAALRFVAGRQALWMCVESTVALHCTSPRTRPLPNAASQPFGDIWLLASESS